MSGLTLEFEGDDLEEALRAAAQALGTSADALDFEVLEDGRRGVFGLGARRVRIAVPSAEPAAPSGTERSQEVLSTAPAVSEPAVATLRRMLDLMGLDLSATADGARIALDGPDRDALTRN